MLYGMAELGATEALVCDGGYDDAAKVAYMS